nr:MAG TPA: holin [Caudoviricetes sp.]
MTDTTTTPTVPDTSTEGDTPNGLIPNRLYDVLKWVAIIVMPALATFIVGLGGIWSIPFAGQLAATITAVGVLLGALLGLSSVKYNSK